MLVNFCVKNPNPVVNYQFSEPFKVNNEHFSMDNVNFHIPTLFEEVKNTSKAKIQSYKRIINAFLVTASSFLMLPLRSMANTSVPTAQMGTTILPKTAEGLPPELLALLLKLLVIAVGTAVILAAILLVGAGVMKMFRKRKEANEWTVDIIKGLIQILVAAPVVFLIYYLANMLFSGGGWHVTPF
jgi:hypothetical protein